MIFVEIAILLVLTLINGALAMAELAVVSSRPVRLQAMGTRGARAALRLLEAPGRFLSSVQIGITLVGVLNGAVSGATLGLRASGALAGAGVPVGVANPLGVGLVVAAITFVSLILGELVPKQIALANPERVAARVAPAMVWIARLSAPVVWLLDGTGRLVLALLGMRRSDASVITDEEIRLTLREATEAGVLLPGENDMISGVMRVADRSARAMMTPRRDIEMMSLADGEAVALEHARHARQLRLPVLGDGPDDVRGVILLNDLIVPPGGALPDLASLVRPVPVVLDTARAVDVIARMRETPMQMVFVYDEYGHFEGMVTSMDLLEAITGDYTVDDEDEPELLRRADGSWLVAGAENADEFSGATGFPLPKGEFATVAGLVIDLLGRIPETGATTRYRGWGIEVVDMDGMRVDKVIVTPPETPTPED